MNRMGPAARRIRTAAVGRFFQVPLTADPVERRLSGTVGGVLWAGGGVIALGPRLFGGAPGSALPLTWAIGFGALAMVWGLASMFVVDWVDGPPWLTHLTAGAGLVTLTVVSLRTGDTTSLGWQYVMWLALFGCFFFRRRAAIGFLALCFLAQLLPLALETDHAVQTGDIWRVAVTAFGYSSVGVAMIQGKELMNALRQRAEREAGTDPVTGLANHRRMDRAMQTQASEALATGAGFALAVIDIDHLKQITVVGGHDAADTALAEIARAMGQSAGPRDVLGRTGGDEFTWLMPGLTAAEAKLRVDGARAIVSLGKRGFPLHFSAGVCDSGYEIDPALLVRLAEGALYWAKLHGRDQTQVYDPTVIDVLSAEERADVLARSQALLGLRALARAIDAKDPATAEHSERVGAIAEALARNAGWDDARAASLRDAARVHDVGKIGIDDAVLRKPSLLTVRERAHVNSHADISGRIVEGVLAPEQVAWIRTHHERADGGGYPQGLCADAIPEGGALLAIADAFDAMTAGRPYAARRTPEQALAVCRADAGTHFTLEAVRALERWLESESESETAPSPAAGRVYVS
jgi:diguanylate cyclase (GGDEF)-like protein